MLKEVVRVGVTNNFGFSCSEVEQLKAFETIHSNKIFFVNSNIHTENLREINNLNNKVVITVNPNLTESFEDISDKLKAINFKRIAFIRIKYIPENEKILNLINEVKNLGLKIVITPMRFKSNKSLSLYTDKKYYGHFGSTWFKLIQDEKIKLEKLCSDKKIFICDKKGLGCQACGLCSKLVCGGKKYPIKSLNLSSSGECKFNCPDCFAKAMQNMLKKFGQPVIAYDVIKFNKKQKK